MSAPVTDAVFIFAPAAHRIAKFADHLGVAYLRTALSREGIITRQYVNEEPGTVRDVVGDLLAYSPRIVGFTAYDANFPLSLSIARTIKQLRPEIITLFGGPTATFGARELLSRHPAIDYCIAGECEETGPQLFSGLLDGRVPLDHPGLAYRRDGEIICNPDPPLVGTTEKNIQCALDVAPSPYLSGILEDGRTGILTVRGCNHDCQYCCFAALGGRKLRLHSIDRVLAELEMIAAHQRRTGEKYEVAIQDDAFTLLPVRAKELCQRIVDRQFDLTFGCITRADTVDDELLKLMWAAGFKNIAYGLESAVPSVLRAIGKVRPPDWHDPDLAPERHFLEQVRRSVVSAKAIGFRVSVSVILGLPTETAEQGATTLRFVEQLPVDSYSHNLLAVLPGTPLWRTHRQYGIEAAIGTLGISETTRHAYDVESLRPAPKGSRERQLAFIRSVTIEAIGSCRRAEADGHQIDTVVLRAGKLSLDIVSWLNEILAIGGLVVHVYPRVDDDEGERIRKRDRSLLREQIVPCRHYVQLEEGQRNDGRISYLLDGSGLGYYRRNDPDAFTIAGASGDGPLLAWWKGQEHTCDLCDCTPATFHSPEMLELKAEIESGNSPFPDLPPSPALRYAERWLTGSGRCSLARLEVDQNFNVRFCSIGEPIGHVGDSRELLLRRFDEIHRAAEARRGCDGCCHAECHRCPFPGGNDEAYCSGIAQTESDPRILNSIYVYSLLPVMIRRQFDKVG